MSNWSDGYITTWGEKFHYYRTGGNKPKVVINHGIGDDGLCRTQVAKELEMEDAVILPNARGQGKDVTHLTSSHPGSSTGE